MGGLFSSPEDGPPTSTLRTNVSVNENDEHSIQLIYTVESASKYSFKWERSGGGWVGVMEAKHGGTLYTHTFPRVVPDNIVQKLKGPSKQKLGNRVIFTFKRSDASYSLQDYVIN